MASGSPSPADHRWEEEEGWKEELDRPGKTRTGGLGLSGLQVPHPFLGFGVNSSAICLANIY